MLYNSFRCYFSSKVSEVLPLQFVLIYSREHLRRVHPLPLHCTRCWLPFANQDSLINHSQAEVPCQRMQPVSIEGWSAEMDKKVTKRKDETERERWERIYRELFGRTLTNVPSPCKSRFVDIMLGFSQAGTGSSELIDRQILCLTTLQQPGREI